MLIIFYPDDGPIIIELYFLYKFRIHRRIHNLILTEFEKANGKQSKQKYTPLQTKETN